MAASGPCTCFYHALSFAPLSCTHNHTAHEREHGPRQLQGAAADASTPPAAAGCVHHPFTMTATSSDTIITDVPTGEDRNATVTLTGTGVETASFADGAPPPPRTARTVATWQLMRAPSPASCPSVQTP